MFSKLKYYGSIHLRPTYLVVSPAPKNNYEGQKEGTQIFQIPDMMTHEQDVMNRGNTNDIHSINDIHQLID